MAVVPKSSVRCSPAPVDDPLVLPLLPLPLVPLVPLPLHPLPVDYPRILPVFSAALRLPLPLLPVPEVAEAADPLVLLPLPLLPPAEDSYTFLLAVLPAVL